MLRKIVEIRAIWGVFEHRETNPWIVVSRHQLSITRSGLLGVDVAGTLKFDIDFVGENMAESQKLLLEYLL